MVKMPRRTFLAISISLLVVGCGGGGGGGTGGSINPIVRPDVPFYTPQRINSYQPLSGATYRTPLVEVYSRDLNGDGRQEVIMQNSSFAPSAAEWQNGSLQIFGWNSGAFKNETTSWFSGTDNVYTGGTTLRFGDFTGNGRVDMFATTFTDRGDLYRPSVVYFNNGNSTFRRADINFGNVDGHDSHVTDLNGDGFSDILIADYSGNMKVAFGSAAGTFTIYGGTGVFGNLPGASSISVADYMGNGTKSIVVTDGPKDGNSDTLLYSWKIQDGLLVMTKISTLPASRFYLSKWDAQRSAVTGAPHEIRNISYDFNKDGRPDVVVFSALDSPTKTNAYSEVQFLRNDGGGVFSDVTDSVLVGFNSNKQPSYNPVLVDVNNDGLLDIFLSTSGTGNSTVLVQTKEGKFVESYGTILSDFAKQIKSLTGVTASDNSTISLVRGPDNLLYLASGMVYEGNDGVAKVAVYLSRLGDASSATAQATIAALTQVWPWMSPADANSTLVQSATLWLDGIPVIDLRNVFSPIGGLGISLDGRQGARMPISGHISVPGFNKNLLNNVVAVDGVGRDWRVNLESLEARPRPMNIAYSHVDAPAQSWSARFVANALTDQQGFSAAGDERSFTTGMTSRYWGWDSPYVLHIGMTNMPGSPWFSFSGMFGNIRSSNVIEASVARQWTSGWWAQTGMQQTITDFDRKMVTNISPVYSAYAIGGWREDGWSLYGGLQPTIFSGSMDLRLPSHVDLAGVLHYQDRKIQIRNDPVTFLGAERIWRDRQHSLSLAAVTNSQQQHSVRANYKYQF